MSLINSMDSLRCTLCRNGLLEDYEVYEISPDSFGVPGEPSLREHTRGYFYYKNTRHYAEVLEIAGNIAEKSGHSFRLLAFDDNAQVDDLILAGGTFYRVEYVREIRPACRILDLEVYRHADPH